MEIGEGFVDVSFMLHCAVYALLKRGEVVYVGQSKKPLTRLYSHAHARGRKSPWKPGYREQTVGFQFDKIWIRPCMLAELDRIEAEMIKKYQPRHNVKGKPRPIPEIPLMELIGMALPPAPMLPPNPEPRWPAWRRF